MAQDTKIERAIADAVAAGLSREKAEEIVTAARATSSTTAAAEPVQARDPVRLWFDGAGWQLDPGALRSGLELLGADEAQVDVFLAEAAERRLNGHMPAPFKGERWIVVAHWDGPEGFQHYKDRAPIWIKNYTELLASDDYIGLTFHQRGILHGLWLEYATANRQLTDSTLTLGRRLGQRILTRDLEALNHAGFIHFSASKPASIVASTPASTEKKRVRTPLPPTGEKHKLPCRYCTQTFTNERLRGEHEQGQHVLWSDKPHTPIEEGT